MTNDRTEARASLDAAALDPLLRRLHAADSPPPDVVDHGDTVQPVQTMYEGAHRFDADALARIRTAALDALHRHAPDPATLGAALGLGVGSVDLELVHARVWARLERTPLDDYRLDFEDGYGVRPDAEEDAEAARAARAVADALKNHAMPASYGIRLKPLAGPTGARALRTADVFVSTLADAHGGPPPGFVVTVPKVVSPDQAAVAAELLAALEAKLGLPERALRFEIQVELPQIVLDADGRCPLRRVLRASRGRMIAAHFGTYDYTAACGIAAEHQAMHHPACVFAKEMMRVAFAGTGVWLSDGSTNRLPVEPHPADGPGAPANRDAVHAAWLRHFDDVTGSLRQGFYQGWDLHPAQLVTRYAALYVFFLGAFDGAAARLRALLSPRAEGTAAVLDDPATGQALLGFVRRAVRCGAIDEDDAAHTCGLSDAELRAGSFLSLQAARGR